MLAQNSYQVHTKSLQLRMYCKSTYQLIICVLQFILGRNEAGKWMEPRMR